LVAKKPFGVIVILFPKRRVVSCTGRVHSQFAGVEQHDSHELMQFLIGAVRCCGVFAVFLLIFSLRADDLHEDTNRVLKKPYVPDAEPADRYKNYVKKSQIGCTLFTLSIKRSDEELADEAWANHRLRNNSHVADLFQVCFGVFSFDV
jgi:ubiquitin carboxyl-terminal hydrolase 4/11/15